MRRLPREITATIFGTVTDPSGAAVSGAAIVVINTDQSEVVRRLLSATNGEYVVPLLPIGDYNISVESPGFKISTLAGITLNVNDHRAANSGLRVADNQQQVTIQADPLQVDLQSSAAVGLISGTEIRELTINTRNFAQLVALQPGVSSALATDQPYVGVSSLNGGINHVSFSINGSRDAQNNWTLDGADNVDRGSNQTVLTYPSIDSIAEFKVLRGNYDPEFGRGAGGQINVVTRSGTNAFHGGAYEFFRNDVLEANNFFNNRVGLARPPLRYNDFGFTLGGPVPIRTRNSSRGLLFLRRVAEGD